jgi:uncharacterized protein YceK
MKTVMVAVLIAILLQGCGTVVHGSKQDLAIKTVPPGAIATVADQKCTTPCTIKNAPRAEKFVYFQKGALKKEYRIQKDLNFVSTFVGNICWLPFGVVFDVALGGAYELRPVNVKLSDLDDATQ